MRPRLSRIQHKLVWQRILLLYVIQQCLTRWIIERCRRSARDDSYLIRLKTVQLNQVILHGFRLGDHRSCALASLAIACFPAGDLFFAEELRKMKMLQVMWVIDRGDCATGENLEWEMDHLRAERLVETV